MNEPKQDKALVAHRNAERHESTDHNPKRPSENMANREGRPSGSLPVERSPSGYSTIQAAGDRPAEVSQSDSRATGVAGPLAQMHKLIERAGEEPFPDDTIRVLSEPINDALVDIRPDGLIYVSHSHYRDRLDRAFGVGGWALVPLAPPRVQDQRVLYYGFLKARGQYIGDAVGGQSEQRGYQKMNYDDAVEGAKSDCLVRCCKALPMFRECWDKDYADYWKATYAVEVAMPQTKSGKGWKKHGSMMRNFDTRPGRASESEYGKPSRLEDENLRHIESINNERRLLLAEKDVHNENTDDYQNEGEWRAFERHRMILADPIPPEEDKEF